MASKVKIRSGFLSDLNPDLQSKIMKINKIVSDTTRDLLKNENKFRDLEDSGWALSCIDEFCAVPSSRGDIGSVRVYKLRNTYKCEIQVTGRFKNYDYGYIEELLDGLMKNVILIVRSKIRREFDMTIRNNGDKTSPDEGFDVILSNKESKEIWDSFDDKKIKTMNEGYEVGNILYEYMYSLYISDDLINYYENYSDVMGYDKYFNEKNRLAKETPRLIDQNLKKFKDKYQFNPNDSSIRVNGIKYYVDIDINNPKAVNPDGTIRNRYMAAVLDPRLKRYKIIFSKEFFELKNDKQRDIIMMHEIGHIHSKMIDENPYIDTYGGNTKSVDATNSAGSRNRDRTTSKLDRGNNIINYIDKKYKDKIHGKASNELIADIYSMKTTGSTPADLKKALNEYSRLVLENDRRRAISSKIDKYRDTIAKRGINFKRYMKSNRTAVDKFLDSFDKSVSRSKSGDSDDSRYRDKLLNNDIIVKKLDISDTLRDEFNDQIKFYQDVIEEEKRYIASLNEDIENTRNMYELLKTDTHTPGFDEKITAIQDKVNEEFRVLSNEIKSANSRIREWTGNINAIQNEIKQTESLIKQAINRSTSVANSRGMKELNMDLDIVSRKYKDIKGYKVYIDVNDKLILLAGMYNDMYKDFSEVKNEFVKIARRTNEMLKGSGRYINPNNYSPFLYKKSYNQYQAESTDNTPEYNVDMSEKQAKATLRTLSQSIINDIANKKGYKVTQYTANIYANIITKNLLPVWAKGFRKFSITLDSYQSFATFEFKIPKMTQDFVSRFVDGKESINGFIHREPEIKVKMSPKIFHTMKNPDDAFTFFKLAIQYYDSKLDKISVSLMTEIRKLGYSMKHLIKTTKLSGLVTYPISLLFVFDDVDMSNKDAFRISKEDIATVNKFVRGISTNYAAPEKEKTKIIEDVKKMVETLHEACEFKDNTSETRYLPEAIQKYYNGGFNELLKEAENNFIAEHVDTDWERGQTNYQLKCFQEQFGVKKLKKIPSDLVAYITIETESIRDANDKMMISSYCISKIDIVEWYIELLEVGSKKYVVPHTKPYLESLRTQLLACLKKIMDTPIPKSGSNRPIIDIQYPKGYEG